MMKIPKTMNSSTKMVTMIRGGTLKHLGPWWDSLRSLGRIPVFQGASRHV